MLVADQQFWTHHRLQGSRRPLHRHRVPRRSAPPPDISTVGTLASPSPSDPQPSKIAAEVPRRSGQPLPHERRPNSARLVARLDRQRAFRNEWLTRHVLAAPYRVACGMDDRDARQPAFASLGAEARHSRHPFRARGSAKITYPCDVAADRRVRYQSCADTKPPARGSTPRPTSLRHRLPVVPIPTPSWLSVAGQRLEGDHVPTLMPDHAATRAPASC
jgi:hypothetical protein